MFCRHSVPVYVAHLLLPEPALLRRMGGDIQSPILEDLVIDSIYSSLGFNS